jgi:hypothetical protein
LEQIKCAQFVEACRSGKFSEFDNIIFPLTAEQRRELIAFDRHACFHLAVANGHRDITEMLIEYINSCAYSLDFSSDYDQSDYDDVELGTALIPVFRDRNGEGLIKAILNKNLSTVEVLLEKSCLEIPIFESISSHLACLGFLYESPLKYVVFDIFSFSCGSGIEYLGLILQSLPESAGQELAAGYAGKRKGGWPPPMRHATTLGDLKVLRFLWELMLPPSRNRLIEEEFPSCLIAASRSGNLEVLQYLWNIVPSMQRKEMVEKAFSYCLIEASEWGHCEVAQFLWDLIPPGKKKELIDGTFPSCCISASKRSRLEILKQFINWAEPKERVSILKAENYAAFIYAADRGNQDVVEFILETLPQEARLEALQANNFVAFRCATFAGHTDTIRFLEKVTPTEIAKKMKAAVNKFVYGPL